MDLLLKINHLYTFYSQWYLLVFSAIIQKIENIASSRSGCMRALWWGVVVTMPSRMTWGGYEVEKRPCGPYATLDKGEANE